jgi:hypothetical protein
LDTVNVLLQFGPNLELGDANDVTPLMQAIRREHTAVISVLLQAGANPNARLGEWDAPLNSARLHKREDIVEMLLRAGAVDDNPEH